MKILNIFLLLLTFSFLPLSAQLMSVNPNDLVASNTATVSSPLKEALAQDIDGLMSKVVKWRHHFHQYPELGNREFKTSKYEIEENKKYILNKNDTDENIKTQFYKVVDARSKKRFEGSEPEIRKGLRSGNIEGSYNLPFQNYFDQTSNTFKKKEDLKKVFENLNLSFPINMVFTCGSGVTACILGMANSIINDKTPLIYDGSWAEYGLIKK